jgi:hypothetical protein
VLYEPDYKLFITDLVLDVIAFSVQNNWVITDNRTFMFKLESLFSILPVDYYFELLYFAAGRKPYLDNRTSHFKADGRSKYN